MPWGRKHINNEVHWYLENKTWWRLDRLTISSCLCQCQYQQTLICVLVARPRRCPTLSNPVPWQNWIAAYLGYTLRMKMLFRGWPVMVHDTHTRRRRSTNVYVSQIASQRKRESLKMMVTLRCYCIFTKCHAEILMDCCCRQNKFRFVVRMDCYYIVVTAGDVLLVTV